MQKIISRSHEEGEPQINEKFIEQLWYHPSFQSRIRDFLRPTTTQIEHLHLIDSSNSHSSSLHQTVSEIAQILSQHCRKSTSQQEQQLLSQSQLIQSQIQDIKHTISYLKFRLDKNDISPPVEDIEIPNLRKIAQLQEKINGLSFMNSFVGDLSVNEKKSEQLSLFKMETLEEKVGKLQEEFTRRIEQIMKTITNIIEKQYSGGSGLMRMIDESKGDKSAVEKGSSFFNKSQKKITSFLRIGA